MTTTVRRIWSYATSSRGGPTEMPRRWIGSSERGVDSETSGTSATHSDGRTYGEGRSNRRSLAAQVDMIHGTESQHRRSSQTPKNRTCQRQIGSNDDWKQDLNGTTKMGYRPPSSDLPSASP